MQMERMGVPRPQWRDLKRIRGGAEGPGEQWCPTEELGGDQSLKERTEGVKEGKKCGLENSGAQTEGSGGERRRL